MSNFYNQAADNHGEIIEIKKKMVVGTVYPPIQDETSSAADLSALTPSSTDKGTKKSEKSKGTGKKTKA